MKIRSLLIGGLALLCASCQPTQQKQTAAPVEKTAFQTGSPWRPEIDVRSDIAIVYGANDHPGMSFTQRLQSWRDHGYLTQFMTGMAWGDYLDFYKGSWDGETHLDLTQLEKDGTEIMHGPESPYVVPDSSFIAYMKNGVVKKVIDHGISTIYLEEPEFWARAGYSEPFKKAWQDYYGFPWRAQHESVENTYLSNKLKYHLFYKAIDEISQFAKSYGKGKGMEVKVFIPTHSLINYSSWEIVSPEASLASLPGIDGYIAQVWTGTSRTPNYFNGKKSERVFENAFLEYGCMISMTAPTKRKMFLLTDPIEDGVRDWADYKQNYEATFTAKLLYPQVANYEVMPWPERIYTQSYKLTNADSAVLIPRFYSTQMQVMVNALNEMPESENQVSGPQGIGVLMNNSMMFQRFPEHDSYADPLFSNFFGQVMPLVKRGVPVELVHMENLPYPESLKNVKVLVLSYSNMKPMDEKSHELLAKWVKDGGTLLYCSKDEDPYQSVMEWWNSDGRHYKSPAGHLFGLLGIEPKGQLDEFQVEKGQVLVCRIDPKQFVMNEGGDSLYLQVLRKAYAAATGGHSLQFNNFFYLQRGPYDLASVMTESTNDQPLTIAGPVIDLFDPELPVLDEKRIEPGKQAFLFNLNRVENKEKATVLASAARIYDEEQSNGNYRFVAKSPANTSNAMRILLPAEARQVSLKDKDGKEVKSDKFSWDEKSQTCLLCFENQPDGVAVSLEW